MWWREDSKKLQIVNRKYKIESMKKTILITVFLFFLSSSLSFAQTPTLIPTPPPKIDYQLPYPGLLPDSPLYFLKVARDRIIDFLIADPLKQAEFDLLQSEKRLAAGITLFGKGKKELAITTISKGENYLEKTISNIETAKSQGADTSSLLEKMYRSVKKQQEVLKVQKGLESLLERLQGFEEKVIKLRE